MTNWTDECHQFGILRKALHQDLVSWHGFPHSEAGAILNCFDPGNPRYLENVDEWQKLLCGGATPQCTLRNPAIRKNAFGSYDIFSATADQVLSIHQVAKLLYKYHGIPRRETDMQAVKDRLSETLPLALDRLEIEGIRGCLAGIRPIDLNDAIGRFGPGATAEGFNSWDKWSRKGFVPDVPMNLYRANPRDPWVGMRSDAYIPTTKIAEVPKSIKSNRIVSSEPAMYMYAQLAVNDALVRQIHTMFKGHVFLHDQERHNLALLRERSCSIDLKDASDHNRVGLVQAVLPQLWPVLARVRSTHAMFHDGEIIELTTFAPMGSGVCFSVMTTVILGICEYARKAYLADHPKAHVWYFVYGDDVIVSLELYDLVMDLLSRAGFIPNHDKSCCNLLYRESCGREMFGTTDITPAYIRDPIATLPAEKVEQVVHHLDERFFPTTARVVAETAQAARCVRWNGKLQRQEVCVRTTSAQQKLRSLDGWSGLNRWFSTRTQGNSWDERRPTGAVLEVWTKPAWRYKAVADYPYLTHWLVTSANNTNNP